MEGQEYLNQISAMNRPSKKTGAGILSSRFLIFGLIGALVLLVLMIIIGALINIGKGDDENLSVALKLRLDNTSIVVQTYQPNIKSSDLRSNSASLYSVLINTSRDLTGYLTEKYQFNERNVNEKIAERAIAERANLETELFEAKINGILDRIYAHKMSYEISILMNEEAKIINSSKDNTLVELLTTSYNSLNNLSSKFNDYSEAK